MALDFDELFDVVGGNDQVPDEGIIERFRFDDALEVPKQLTDVELWGNYVNNDLYEMDKRVRGFLSDMRWNRRSKGGMKTTASLVFTHIFGRKPTPSDGHLFRWLHLLLKYYCTSYTGQTTFMGRKVNRVYKFSRFAATNKRPYSLRLRIEEMEEGANYAAGAIWHKGPGQDRDKRGPGRADRKDGADADEPGGGDS